MSKLDKVIEFLEKLKESLGKDYLIAGGCARDIKRKEKMESLAIELGYRVNE